METGESKIDQDLRQTLDKLTDQEEIDVLLYPKQMDEAFKGLLQSKKNEGLLDFWCWSGANG